MLKLKEAALKEEDFEALKALNEDVKRVFAIGKEIWSLKREIKFCVAKEDYPRAIDLKNRLRQLESKRDGFDALYETTRYEDIIVMGRPSTADYYRKLQMLDAEEEANADAQRR